MNRLLIVLFAVLFSLTAVAQQDPQLTQFYQDRLSFNPAFAGAERLQYVSAFYRNQWNGLETNPQTTLVQYNGKPGFIPGGIGLSFFQDKLGQEENTVVKLAYAYHMEPDANGGILSLGSRRTTWARPWATNGFTSMKATRSSPKARKAAAPVDADLGVMYRVPGSYYAGISTTRMAATDLKDLNISSVRHLYLQAGYEQGSGRWLIAPALPLAGQDGSERHHCGLACQRACGTTSSMEAFLPTWRCSRSCARL